VVAALIAAASVVLLVTYVSSQTTSTASNSTAPRASTTRAVVATADLNAGDRLSAANVAVQDFPTSGLPLGGAAFYFTDVNKLLSPPQYASSKLPRGALILATLLVAQPASTTVEAPIDISTANDVAIAVPFDESKGAGGFVQPEDHLDILVDDNTTSVQYAFQDVRVIKVGGHAEQGVTAGTANLLLVELPREHAAVLAYLIDRGFNIRYVIRPHDQFGKGPLPNSAPVNGSNWNQFLAR
jgi:Flp pilus assembly protein CpaB